MNLYNLTDKEQEKSKAIRREMLKQAKEAKENDYKFKKENFAIDSLTIKKVTSNRSQLYQ